MKRMRAILQWALALVFAVAAGLKLAWVAGRGASAAAGVQTMFSALPVWGQWLLVGGELALAFWLASGWRPRLGAFVTIVVLSVFLAAVVVEMGKPHPRPCGCLGNAAAGAAAGDGHLGWTLALDGGLLALALGVYYASLTSGRPRVGTAA